jgi:hypothetical protein
MIFDKKIVFILVAVGITGCNFNSNTTTFGNSISGTSAGSSSSSNPPGTTTTTTTVTLAAPTVSVTASTSSTISLSWTTVSGGSVYTLFMNGNSSFSTTGTTYTETGLSAGTTYCFSVQASGTSGNSAVSSQTCATTMSSSGSSGTTGSASNNVMQVTVNGSLCSASTTADAGYLNKPCASVTICQPGTSNCQTVSDILVDTGSYGLRVFPSGTNANGTSYNLSSLSLPAVTQSGQNVATCAQFLDGSALWGQVVKADLNLVTGGETASSIPIQLINSSYGGTVPSDCDGGQAAANASDAGFNGIIGIGLWEHDCGTDCDPSYQSSVSSSGIQASYYPYYTCSGDTCSQALVSISNQVTNPISAFPVNNNGLVFELPSIAAAGTASVSGSIILGIGTGGNTNNTLSNTAHVYYADAFANFATVFNGVTYSDSSSSSTIMGSFIDSGSNSFLFDAPSGVNCCSTDSNDNVLSTTVSCSNSSSSGWICSSYNGSATNEGVGYSTGAPLGSGVAASFAVENFYTLASGSNMVFNDLAAADIASTSNPATFDWAY